jgi:hypothetical protein
MNERTVGQKWVCGLYSLLAVWGVNIVTLLTIGFFAGFSEGFVGRNDTAASVSVFLGMSLLFLVPFMIGHVSNWYWRKKEDEDIQRIKL